MSPAENKLSVYHNINLLYILEGSPLRKGSTMTDVKPLQNGYIVVEAGKIKEVGSGNGYLKYQDANFYSLAGKTVVPGFIDSHTHLVFAGSRENEMRRKLQGESYLEILKSGGGILSTVRKTREASFDTLYKEARTTLERMLSFGVTSVEAKSGYGLDLETELKQLEVVAKLKAEGPQTLVSTFMGAHALPGEYHDNRQAYFALLEKALYEIKKRNLASFVDIFCEEGVFSVSESREFLGLAKELGFKLKIHADELSALGGAALATELKAVSAEHLLASSDEDLQKLASSDTIAVLLPLTSFYLNKPFAKARVMIDYGCAVALASDYNPGSSPSENLQLAMQFAVLKMKMTPERL